MLLFKPPMLLHRRPIPIAISVCLHVVCRFVCCGQTLQDRSTVCIEVEDECGGDISIFVVFDHPNQIESGA